jgi:hypothetical protein
MDDPRRNAERHHTDLACDLGEVVDLSGTGMRITCKGKPQIKLGLVRKIKIRCADGNLLVIGRSVWMKRRGLRRFEVGIQFVDLKPGVARALESLAKFGFVRGAPVGESTSRPKRRRPKIQASVDLPDYYKVLGLARGATPDEIRNAYRLLARKYHPDVSTEDDGQQKFIVVREAYETLRDPKRRMNYDVRMAG